MAHKVCNATLYLSFYSRHDDGEVSIQNWAIYHNLRDCVPKKKVVDLEVVVIHCSVAFLSY